MAAKKYLRNLLGRLTETSGIVTSAGAGNDGDLVALDAAGKIDASVLPAGLGVNTIAAIATEALSAGDLVNIYDVAGTASCRKADATTAGKEAYGFVKASVASSGTATIYCSGNLLTGLSGMTTGMRQYLLTTPGTRGATAPTGSANIVQMVGVAISATALLFEPEEPITLA